MVKDIQLEIDTVAKRRDNLGPIVEALETVYLEKLGAFNRLNEDIRGLVKKRDLSKLNASMPVVEEVKKECL